MCGIYGFQIRPGYEASQHEVTLMSLSLAYDMETRGRDSFGGVRIPTKEDEDKAVDVFRGVGKVSEAGGGLFRLAGSSRTFLGHTRAATKGAVSIPNCHPFAIGDLLGVHNGVINNHEYLNRKYSREFAVDSMHAFAHIDQGLPLNELFGYGTFFWSRSSENWTKIYFAKTNGGSLTVAKLFRDKKAKVSSEDHFAVVWASEYGAISKLAKLLDVEYYTATLYDDYIFYIEEGMIFSTNDRFRLGNPIRDNAGKLSYLDHLDENSWDAWLEMEKTKASTNNSSIESSPGCKIPSKKKAPSSSGGRNGNHTYLSRKEKKALKRHKRQARRNNWVLDPIPSNLNSGWGLGKVYIPKIGGSGPTETQFLCPECECLLASHQWGFCKNNGVNGSSCKAKDHHIACNMTPSASLTQLSSCFDCGHTLVSGVHKVSTAMLRGCVECLVCNNYCVPEAMVLSEDEDDPVHEEVDEITEQEPDTPKVTEIILRSSIADQILLDRVKEFNGTS